MIAAWFDLRLLGLQMHSIARHYAHVDTRRDGDDRNAAENEGKRQLPRTRQSQRLRNL